MANRLFLLLLAAGLGAAGGQAQRQTEVTHYAYQRNHYADVDGDGAMEHLEKLNRTVYDYPEGSLPGAEGAYYNPAQESETLRIVDGAYYQLFRMIEVAVFKDGQMTPYEPGMEELEDFVITKIVYEGAFTTMSIEYPEGREPDIKDGLNYWFRITSQEDVDKWLNNTGYSSMGRSSSEWGNPVSYLFNNGTVWKYAGKAPSHYDTRTAWTDFNGNPKVYIDGTEDKSVIYSDINTDYNADGITDVFFVGENDKIYIALSTPDGYVLKDTGIAGSSQTSLNYIADLNRDGRPDIFGWESISSGGTVTRHTPVTFIQMGDGTFMRKPLNVVTDAAEINDATFSTGGNGSFKTSYINMSGMSGGKGSDVAGKGSTLTIADINLDGYPDLIDENGHSFMSLPDGRYYAAAFAGTVTHSDLNGDGIPDLVIFDSPNKQVLLYMSNGTGFDMTQLIENGNISAMHCRDLDGDGKTDILLCIDTPRNENYAYLAFFRNNGDGTFRRTVRTLEGSLEFSKPFDLNNNGRPTLIATEKSSLYEYHRIDWDERFAITETALFPRQYDHPINQMNDFFTEFADYDGDGQVEIIAYLADENGSYRTYLYCPAMANANTAPQRMDAPRVIADRSNGQVKIEWTAGSDNETAACDLIYNVRISTAESTNVMLRECNGTQMIANAGTWPLGTMNVSVRATDTNGLCGEWSAPAPFVNETANALFTMDKAQMATADTLTVRTVDGSPATFRATPDGIVKTLSDGQALITFDTAGSKTITATAPGGGSSTERINVSPIKLEDVGHACGVSINSGFDLNQNGTIEGIDVKLYTFDNGQYTYYPAFSLSDVSIVPIAFADFNMDGQPDILGRHTKNGREYPWLVNDGDLEFTTATANYTDVNGSPFETNRIDHVADFNNDGLTDFIYDAKLYTGTTGGGVQYVAYPEITGWQPNEIIGVTDFNLDGRTDIIMLYYNQNNPKNERFSTYILRNDGGMNFTPVCVFDSKEIEIHAIKDVDNDGCPDIIVAAENLGYGRYTYRAYSGGRDMTEWKAVELPGYPITTDIDNDGMADFKTGDNYILDGDSLLLSGMNGMKMAAESESWYSFSPDNDAPDLNADGRPDPGMILLSRFANTAPTAPTEVFANTTGRYVTVNWSGATDAETTVDRLRYNLSIRKKGARGAGSYIISPLNATDSRAAMAPAMYGHYRYGTQTDIPVDRFEAGTTYEICVQTIDPWYAHSPFSKVFEFTPQATAMISMAQRGGVGMPMPIQIYDNSGAEPVIDADGGTVSGRIITWSTPGLKTVSVTAGTAKAEHRILIADRPMLRLNLPEQILTGDPVVIALPDALMQNEGVNVRLWADDGMDVQHDARTNTAVVTARNDGGHVLHISYTDDIFTSPIDEYAETRSAGAGFRPELAMVGVDGATGKNRVSWNSSMTLPQASLFTGKVAVYRETTIAGDFEKIGECNISDGGFTDSDSRPDIESNRYMISLPTAYGTESTPSAVHGSIHLMVNRGMGNDINLHWTPYEGASVRQYTIMSGTSPEALQPLTTLSGNARSFTHRRDADRTTFYSIAYTLQSDARPAPATHNAGRAMAPAAGGEGASNVISSDDAYSVTMAESIIIGTRENTTVIGQATPQLHLTATVMPAIATIGNVEWSIERGDNLAAIAPDGTLSVLDNATGGIVTVRARATDGSDVTATMDFTAEAYANGIGCTAAERTAVTIRPGYREVLIDPNGKSTDITISGIGGGIVHRSTAKSAVKIALQPGFYIVKAGQTVKKIGVK